MSQSDEGIEGAVEHQLGHPERIEPQPFEVINQLGEVVERQVRLASTREPEAEAAPEEFLAAVDRGLAGQSPLLINLFTDTEYHAMERSPHTGLLWALELLAWSPEYVSQATLLLAKLARLDPGGKPANRPLRSLQHIFLFQYPSTTAPLEQRLRVLDTIRKREPQVAWRLLVSLLPIRDAIAHPTFEPRWRAWTPEDRPAVTYGELFRAASEIIQRLLVDVGTDGRRWHDRIEALHALPRAEFETIIERLLTLDPETFAPADRLSVWSSLRHVIALQLKFPDKAWALPREQVERLQQIYTRFEPDDPVLQRSWLFTNRPELPQASDTDRGKRQNTLERLRMQAVQELLERGGLPMVLDLTRQVERPWYVGIALGQSNVLTGREDEDRLLIDIPGSPDTPLRQMAFGFLQARVRTRGQVWIETLRRREVVQTWTPQQRADLYQYLPFSPGTWEALEATDVETQRLYWLQVSMFGRGELPVENCEQAVLRFLQYGRLDAAVQLLTSDADRDRLRLRSLLIADVLERVVQEDTPQPTDGSALAEADVSVDQTYRLPRESHNPMEPHATIARWDGDQLALWDKSQWVTNTRDEMAAVFGLAPEHVHVVSPFIGGASGTVLRTWPHVTLAALAARHVGRPVKLVLTRRHMYTGTGYRPDTWHRVALGASREGRLTATIHEATAETSQYEQYTEAVLSATRLLHSCPKLRTRYRLVALDVHTPTYMRGPGEASGIFALECALDELSYALGVDPVELRLRNEPERDEERNLPFSSRSTRECYRVGAERFGWSRRNPKPRSMRDGRWLIGWGMAAATYRMLRNPASARVRLAADGSAVVESAASDMGPGTYTSMTQVACDALGLPPERVRLALGGSTFPRTPSHGDSRTMASVGPVVHAACLAVRCADVAEGGCDA